MQNELDRKIGDRAPIEMRVELPTPRNLAASTIRFFAWRTNAAKTRLVDGAVLAAGDKVDISADESPPKAAQTVWKLSYTPTAALDVAGIHLGEFEEELSAGNFAYYPEGGSEYIEITVREHKGKVVV